MHFGRQPPKLWYNSIRKPLLYTVKKRFLAIFIFIIYCVVLIEIMVFKDIPTIRVGSLMLNFGGTDANGQANFVPFRTIVPYLLGYEGWIIAGVNLVGNIVPLVPIGLLVPFVYRKIIWKKTFALSVIAGLTIETMQTILHVGIFDIDDVILNALGVMIGYWVFITFVKWARSGKYKNILFTILLVVAVSALAVYAIYPKGQQMHQGAGVGSGHS